MNENNLIIFRKQFFLDHRLDFALMSKTNSTRYDNVCACVWWIVKEIVVLVLENKRKEREKKKTCRFCS